MYSVTLPAISEDDASKIVINQNAGIYALLKTANGDFVRSAILQNRHCHFSFLGTNAYRVFEFDFMIIDRIVID